VTFLRHKGTEEKMADDDENRRRLRETLDRVNADFREMRANVLEGFRTNIHSMPLEGLLDRLISLEETSAGWEGTEFLRSEVLRLMQQGRRYDAIQEHLAALVKTKKETST
jgi:hypothetical protein